MPADREKVEEFIRNILKDRSIEELERQLGPKPGDLPPRLRSRLPDQASLEKNWKILKENTTLTEEDQKILTQSTTSMEVENYANNIENCVGAVRVPVGVAGPLRINGVSARGDFYVPMATTEGALVASYARGARLIGEAGGCTTIVTNDGITRAPGFAFENLREASRFVLWAMEQFDAFQEAAGSTTSHGRLRDMRTTIEGNHVYINFDFTTGDASGQNMATIATAEILKYISKNSPIKPVHAFVEANFSGDKKASALSYLNVRGKKVTAEVHIAEHLVKKILHTTPETMVAYWRMGALGGVMSGTMGVQGHFANGLTAIYLATGQDVACVAESAVGITRMEILPDGGLYATVTLPNIIVGTVGGGTGLPSQSVGLRMLQVQGEGQVHALAEVCAATCLAGELSIMGAMCAGDFASAHQQLARGGEETSG